MNQPHENNTVTGVSPEEALENFLGEQYIEWLMVYIGNQVRNWPEWGTIRAAQPKIEKIRKFMLQRFLAAEAFVGGKDGDPGFLGFAVANLSESNDPLAESALEILEKKRQEEFSGPDTSGNTPMHNQLWLKLLHSLGVSDDEIKRAEAKEVTRNYIAELSDVYSNSDWQATVGAFAAHERSLSEEYTVLSDLLKRQSSVSDQDLEILNRHKGSINTTHVLDKVVFDKENKLLVWEGVKRQMDARKDFYSGLLKYLEDQKTA